MAPSPRLIAGSDVLGPLGSLGYLVPENFGAKADGSDDTAYFNMFPAGSLISLTPGKTYIVDRWIPPAGLTLHVPRSSSLQLKNGSTGSLVRLQNAGFGVTGQGVLDANAAGQAGLRDCIQILSGANAAYIGAVELRGATRAGINATGVSGLVVEGTRARSCAQYGGFFDTCSDTDLSRFDVRDIGSNTLHHGMTFKTCSDVRNARPLAWNCAGIGVEDVGGYLNRHSDVSIKNFGNIGVSIAAGDGNTSIGCGVDGGTIDGSTTYGAEIAATGAGVSIGAYLKGLFIQGNSGTLSRGASVSGSGAIEEPVVQGNTFRQCLRSLTGGGTVRRLNLANNMSIDPNSYHYEVGGQRGVINGNVAYNGTKAFVFNTADRYEMKGNYQTGATEHGVFGVGSCTFIDLGGNNLGAIGGTISGAAVWAPSSLVPTENIVGFSQIYDDAGVLKVRSPTGTVTTL